MSWPQCFSKVDCGGRVGVDDTRVDHHASSDVHVLPHPKEPANRVPRGQAPLLQR